MRRNRQQFAKIADQLLNVKVTDPSGCNQHVRRSRCRQIRSFVVMKDINQSLGDLGRPPHPNRRHLACAGKDVHRFRAILELVGHIEHALGKFRGCLPNFRPKFDDRFRPSLSLLFGHPRKGLNLRDRCFELRLRINRRRTDCENRRRQVMRKRPSDHHSGRT